MNVIGKAETFIPTSRDWPESGRPAQGITFDDEQLGPHLFLANGSRVYAVPEEFAAEFSRLERHCDSAAIDKLLTDNGLDAQPYINDDPVAPFPVHAISLAVAQKCNLGCTYCYAQGGDFGRPARSMSTQTAIESVRQLIDGVSPGERVNIAFMGGEPLVNRNTIREATEFAEQYGEEKGVRVGFSITTNGTLVTADDGDFFERHGFAVTVSLDGVGQDHDRLRPYKGGRGSYDRIISNITPLLAKQHRMQVTARITVTPKNLDLPTTLRHFIGLGFHSVGFSPMLASPTGRDEMGRDEINNFLEQMIACGRDFESAVLRKCRYPFHNLVTALKEINRGTHRPYPCGAGAGYLGVGADGGLFACHRFVDDEAGRMGTLQDGLQSGKRWPWLHARHVHKQEPCAKCWARYLCGGGCHHEVIKRGRPACDYIRGWLKYCLGAYVRLGRANPNQAETPCDAGQGTGT